MSKRVLLTFVLAAAVAVTGCSSDGTASPTERPAATSSATETSSTSPTSAVAVPATEATSATEVTSTTGTDYSAAICDAIRTVQADLVPLDASADAFKAQIAVALSGVLPLDASTSSLIDDAAVERECPTEYADLLAQADITSLRDL